MEVQAGAAFCNKSLVKRFELLRAIEFIKGRDVALLC